MKRNIGWAAGLVYFYFVLDISLGRAWLSVHILPSLLISFCGFLAFSVFLSSLYLYKPLRYVVPLLSLGAALPLLNFFYYKNYADFISHQLLQAVVRESAFFIAILKMQILPYVGWVMLGMLGWCVVAHWLLRGLFATYHGPYKPLDLLKNPLFSLLALVILVICYIKPIEQHRFAFCCYTISAAVCLPFLWFLFKINSRRIRYVTYLCLLVFAGGVLTYTFPLRNYIPRLALDGQSIVVLFNALYAPANQLTLQQPEELRQVYRQIIPPPIPFNVLVIVNDALRARSLGIYGAPRYPDQALQNFYQKSYVFQYALSPSHYTISSMPAIFSAMGPQRHPIEVKNSRRLWDFAPPDLFTFYILSANKHWSSMDKYIESYNMQHLWSASNDGGREHALDVVDDEPAIRYTQQLLQKHPRYLGVLHTHGTHFPYYQNPQTKPYYKPCSSNSRAQWPQATINCYDNAIIHFTQQEAILLDNIDLSNTVVIFTADHGEAFLEHNAYFHGDLYDEVVHVPFVWYIPPAIVEKIPTENWQAFKQNLTRYVSVTDIVPSILHLSSLLTGQEPAYKKTDFTGRSLFEDRDNDLIIISGCLVDLVCTKRDVVFADENYFVLLKPNRANPVEIYPAKDLEQKHPLTPQEISLSKLQNIYEKAPQAHPLGGLLHSLLKKQFPQLENLSR